MRSLAVFSVSVLAVIPMQGVLAGGALAGASGEWSISRSDCQYPHGVRDGVRIAAGSISGLEWSCEIRSSSTKNGYTVAKASCGAEGEDINTTLKYRVDGKGLHFKWGKQPERLYAYRCK